MSSGFFRATDFMLPEATLNALLTDFFLRRTRSAGSSELFVLARAYCKRGVGEVICGFILWHKEAIERFHMTSRNRRPC